MRNQDHAPDPTTAPLAARWRVSVEDDGPGAAETYARWREENGRRLTSLYDVRRAPGPFRATSTWLGTPGLALAESTSAA